MRGLRLLMQLLPGWFWLLLAALVAVGWRLTSPWVACLFTLLPVLLVSLIFFRRFVRPLLHIQQGLERLASGALDAGIYLDDALELSKLARAANRMAGELRQQVEMIAAQRNEQQALLSGLDEAVIALDGSERVKHMNAAALELCARSEAEVIGRAISEVLRHAPLQRFVAGCLQSAKAEEEQLVFECSGKERVFQAYGRRLANGGRCPPGVLIVLNEVTRLHQLENMRREFVANVSHELKTPITTIKGSVETLLGGAAKNPADAGRFLNMIMRQADRLNAIIEDLLSLSRIEQGGEKGQIEVRLKAIKEVIKSAIGDCKHKAAQHGVIIRRDCQPADLKAWINPVLLEQALVNLIDNAVKCSPRGGEVRVAAANGAEEIVLTVRDKGKGIEERHLPRLFERFYRVEKARSRQEGGTGLGLAIVKHIAQAHGGRVSVESKVNEGSVFRMHLPKEQGKPLAEAGETG